MNRSDKLWKIGDKLYDLTEFAKTHPGGFDNIMSVKGTDCTNLFMSIHNMKKMDKIQQMLEKYYVKSECSEIDIESNTELIYTFNNNDFFHIVSTRVKEYFIENKMKHKANLTFWSVVGIQLIIFIWSLISALYLGTTWFIIPAAISFMGLGFNVFHTGMHFGISKNEKINWVPAKIWSYFAFWYYYLWIIHHNNSHHAYTGIYKKDVDLGNSIQLLRKTELTKYKYIYKVQHILNFILLFFIPNQFIGQIIIYTFALITGKLFTIKLNEEVYNANIKNQVIKGFLTTFLIMIVLPIFFTNIKHTLICNLIFYMVSGMLYSLNVIPNHDTYKIRENEKNNNTDWGVRQVLSSANHTPNTNTNTNTKNTLINFIIRLWNKFIFLWFGGMNYQIEHHLFPTVCYVHYEAISEIVKKTCEEFQIPYTVYDGYIDALQDNYRLLKCLATE